METMKQDKVIGIATNVSSLKECTDYEYWNCCPRAAQNVLK